MFVLLMLVIFNSFTGWGSTKFLLIQEQIKTESALFRSYIKNILNCTVLIEHLRSKFL